MRAIRNAAATLSLILFFVSANKAQSLRYGGMQQISLGFNQDYTSAAFVMVNGVRFHKFFAGLGADVMLESSYYNTSAFFADGRYYINEKKNFFAKVNAGVNIITARMSNYEWIRSRKQPGYIFSGGLGFKARLGKEVFYTFDVSYCARQLRFIEDYRDFRTGIWETKKFNILRSMITVNMGFEIF